MKKFLLVFLFPLLAFSQAYYHIKPSANVILSNGADYEMRFSFSGRDFIVPRDAILELYFDTHTYYTLTIYRGDNNSTVWTGSSEFIPDNYRKHYGIRQTSSNAFQVHQTNIVMPAPEPFVQFNNTPNVWVQNTELGYPIDVNLASGGGGAGDTSGLDEKLLHIWAILIASFIILVVWLGYRIYHR